jgi:hypothetical protein
MTLVTRTSTRMSPRAFSAALVAIGALCALLLALPGQTVTTKYVNDLFVFLDGAHRILSGQVPNRDFHTALGPLSFYIPALGYAVTGSWGAAMPLGMALATILVTPVAAYVVSSRLRPEIGLPLGAYLLVMLAMPLNPGENIRSLSFAMFYNRIGWAALGLLLVMYLPPAGRDRPVLDALCGAFLTLLLLYTKASYGIVAFGFLIFLLLDTRQRGWAASALLTVTGMALGVEAVWRATGSHVADLLMAGRVSGGLGTPDTIGAVLFANLADHVVFALIAGLALAVSRSFRDLLFYGFCAGAGFLLLKQNFQVWGVIVLAPAAAVAAERIARSRSSAGSPGRRLALGAPLAVLALVVPPLVQGGAALVLHSAVAALRLGDPVPLPRFPGVRLVKLWSPGEHPTFVTYLATIADGSRTLARLQQPPERVLVLDFANPFSAGLGLTPARGDSPWYHWGRTLDEGAHPGAGELFADVAVVLEPKWPVESWTAEGMRRAYDQHLRTYYGLKQESEFWRVYVRDPSGPNLTASRAPGSP